MIDTRLARLMDAANPQGPMGMPTADPYAAADMAAQQAAEQRARNPLGLPQPNTAAPAPADVAAANSQPTQVMGTLPTDPQAGQQALDPETLELVKGYSKDWREPGKLEHALSLADDVMSNLQARIMRGRASRWQGTSYAQNFSPELMQTREVGAQWDAEQMRRQANDPSSPMAMQAAQLFAQASGLPLEEVLRRRQTAAQLQTQSGYLPMLTQRAGVQQRAVATEAKNTLERDKMAAEKGNMEKAGKDLVTALRSYGVKPDVLPDDASLDAAKEVVDLLQSKMQGDAKVALAAMSAEIQERLTGMREGAANRRAQMGIDAAAERDQRRLEIEQAQKADAADTRYDGEVREFQQRLYKDRVVDLDNTIDQARQGLGQLTEQDWSSPQFKALLATLEEDPKSTLVQLAAKANRLYTNMQLDENDPNVQRWFKAIQPFQTFKNMVLKDRSGSAVTGNELQRAMAELSAGLYASPSTMMNALDRSQGILRSRVHGLSEGLSDGASRTLRARSAGDPKSTWLLDTVRDRGPAKERPRPGGGSATGGQKPAAGGGGALERLRSRGLVK